MMSLDDNEFDSAFKKKVFDMEPPFEEEAWNRMERKLKKRDRVVFFRKATVACLLLLVGFGFYTQVFENAGQQLKKEAVFAGIKKDHLKPAVRKGKVTKNSKPSNEEEVSENVKILKNTGIYRNTQVAENREEAKYQGINKSTKTSIVAVKKSNSILEMQKPEQTELVAIILPVDSLQLEPMALNKLNKEKKIKITRKRPLPLSLAFGIGPELNSSEALIGHHAAATTSILLGMGLSKRLHIQTGLRYSIKNYTATGYNYQFKNPGIVPSVAGVDAACNVLELPLLASYTVHSNRTESFEINTGLSSYFMLKENYTIRYTAESGEENRYIEKNNANRHFLSVIDLSATYYVKIPKRSFSLGLEPFVKIPLAGVGEGKVNLKSTGISLKLRYDLSKKNN